MIEYFELIFVFLSFIALAVILIQSFLTKEKHTCCVKVRSLRTGCVYKAHHYRIKNGVMELRVYNYYTDTFEWHAVWHFRNANDIMAYLNAAYVCERYGIKPRVPRTNDFSHKKTSQKFKNLI